MVWIFGSLTRNYLRYSVIHLRRMPLFASKIYAKCGLFDNVWGYIDGTLRKTCRPAYFQTHIYSEQKRCHGLKVQYIVTPDYLLACLGGPMNGNKHESHILCYPNLLNQMRVLMLNYGYVLGL